MIDAAMKRIAERVHQAISGAKITTAVLQPEKAVTRLLVRANGAQIKIEVTPVLRGCVYEPELRTVSHAVEEAFGFAEIRVVSFADLYAGKIVAALDRQHPRDLFDVRDLLANEGIDDALRRAFLVYLLSHNRPMAEVLAPQRKSISDEFLRGFQGMTAEPVSLDELTRARESLIDIAVGKMLNPTDASLSHSSVESRTGNSWECLPHTICQRSAGDSKISTRWRRRSVLNLSLN